MKHYKQQQNLHFQIEKINIQILNGIGHTLMELIIIMQQVNTQFLSLRINNGKMKLMMKTEIMII